MECVLSKAENWNNQCKQSLEDLNEFKVESFRSDGQRNRDLNFVNEGVIKDNIVQDYLTELKAGKGFNDKEDIIQIESHFVKSRIAQNERLFESEEPCDIDYLHTNLKNTLEDLLKTVSSESSVSEDDGHWDYSSQTPTQDQLIIRNVETGERKIQSSTVSHRLRVLDQDYKNSYGTKNLFKENDQDQEVRDSNSIECDRTIQKEMPKKTRFVRKIEFTIENESPPKDIVNYRSNEETVSQKVNKYIDKELDNAKKNTKLSIFPFLSYIIGIRR